MPTNHREAIYPDSEFAPLSFSSNDHQSTRDVYKNDTFTGDSFVKAIPWTSF
jgi:hypothetical protein